MDLEEFTQYQKVQDAARKTLDDIITFIKPGVSELDIVRKCDELQRGFGVNGYWYKSLPALVLVGERTSLAISRTPYEPSDIPAETTDLVTIDLNPALDGYCGDMARTYYIEGGRTRSTPLRNEEFLAGSHAQAQLHSLLLKFGQSSTTFDELYLLQHEAMDKLGFEQLDYLGHGVQKDMSQLDFIEEGVMRTLGGAGLFTLEPQIRIRGGTYGFKHENIYYFHDGKIREL